MPEITSKGVDFEEAGQVRPRGVNYLLVIAVNEYEHHPKLSNCISDAQSLMSVLQNKYGFREEHSFSLYNKRATLENIFKNFYHLAKKVTSNDSVIIYLSGHGYYDKVEEAGYFIPVDAHQNETWTYFHNSILIDKIRSIKSLHTFLIVDSCFSGSLFVRKGDEVNRYTEELEKWPSRWVLASGRLEPVADGPIGGHSPFAQRLLDFLNTNSEVKVPVSEVVYRVAKITANNSMQTPIGGVLYNVGDSGGQFVFSLKEKSIDVSYARHQLPRRRQTHDKEDLEVKSELPRMVSIEGGSFEMGDSFGDGYECDDEMKHEVHLKSFSLSAFQVTFEEFDIFCEMTDREKPDDNGWGRGLQPVINISWDDAVQYCIWLSRQENLQVVYSFESGGYSAIWFANGYRLPTEAEWEFAARERGKKLRFGNGKDTADPREINFDGSKSNQAPYSKEGKYREKTTKVGSFNSNELGLFDMSGNVYEWCWDWYSENYFKDCEIIDPRGPSTGTKRVLKGGSWYNSPVVMRNSYRHHELPSALNNYTGFRLARSIVKF